MLASFSFSIIGEQCPLVYEQCLLTACETAGGHLSEYGACLKVEGEEYDESLYQEEVDKCLSTNDFCIENDGLVKNMSCFGPVFMLLSVLMLALYADGTS